MQSSDKDYKGKTHQNQSLNLETLSKLWISKQNKSKNHPESSEIRDFKAESSQESSCIRLIVDYKAETHQNQSLKLKNLHFKPKFQRKLSTFCKFPYLSAPELNSKFPNLSDLAKIVLTSEQLFVIGKFRFEFGTRTQLQISLSLGTRTQLQISLSLGTRTQLQISLSRGTRTSF